MKLQRDCESCNERIKLDYDETECTPEYCPFCGEELNGEEGDYELDRLPSDSEWDE